MRTFSTWGGLSKLADSDSPGEVLHGDRDGVLTVPKEIAAKVPTIATQLQAAERKVIDFCRSKNFSIDALRQLMKQSM